MLARRLLIAGGGGSFVGPSGLQPSSILTINRSGSNPTFNFNSLVENMILVGSTYWACYQPSANDIRLASASSPDGPWTAYGSNPVITGASLLYAPHLMEDVGTFYLFYSVDVGGPAGIAYATASSVTGPYTKIGYALSQGSAGAWDDLRVGECSILQSGSTYYMAYMGDRSPEQSAEQVGIATATSLGGTWTKSASNPVLTFGGSGQWDHAAVADPFIFYVAPYFWIYYSGFAVDSTTPPWQAGLAYASDPVNGPWTKFSGNPIIGASGSGFDDQGAFRGAIYIDGSGYHLTYTGLPAGGISLATMKGGNATIAIS